MYLQEETANFPLFEIDVRAWYMVAVILGEVSLPSKEDINEQMIAAVKEGMQIHYVRSYIDRNYQNLCYEFECKVEEEMDNDHWTNNPDDPRMTHFTKEGIEFTMRRFAQEMKDANYPVQFGSLDGLNEKGKLLSQMVLVNDLQRTKIAKKTTWETFRDIDPTGFASIHTGTLAVPLKARWMDIDDADPNPHLTEEFVRQLDLQQGRE